MRSAASWTSTETAPYAFVLGRAKKRSATSRWTMTVQWLDARQPVEALDDQRRRDVVRQVRDELRRRGLERGEVEAQRVAEYEIDVLTTAKALGEMWLERAVELDGVHARDSLGEVVGQNPQAGPDLEHDVVSVELGEAADDAEDVVVDEEVLAEVAVGRDRKPHGSENAAAAFAVDPRTELGRVVAAGLGELVDREHDVRGLVRPAAAGLRREVGAVRLGEDPLGRNLRRRGSQIGTPSGT